MDITNKINQLKVSIFLYYNYNDNDPIIDIIELVGTNNFWTISGKLFSSDLGRIRLPISILLDLHRNTQSKQND